MKKGTSEEIETVFLIADLSGYTALTEAHGDISAVEIVTRYVEIVRAALHPGAELVERVGDEVLIVSPEAASLVYTAIALREAIEHEALFPTMHAGIHGGKVVAKDGHYYGRALNLASRVAAHARGDQILCTEWVAASAKDLKDVEYRALGLTQFKNITEPVAIFEVLKGQEKGNARLIDPVCRMQVREDTAPGRLSFGEKTYYFCSFDCVKMFVNHPDSYAAI